MRTIKELLQVMLDNQQYFEDGLCSWVTDLYWESKFKLITHNEVAKIKAYITENRPSKFSSISAFKNRHREYYWEVGNINPRIEWLKKHIKKNS